METFHYARSLKRTAVIAYGIFFILTVGFIGLALFERDQIAQSLIVAAFFGWLARLIYQYLQRMDDVIVADANGLEVRSGRERRRIRWSDIVDVRTRLFQRSLVLYAGNDHPLLEVHYEITGFDRLRELIGEKTPWYSSMGEPDAPYVQRVLLVGVAACLLTLVGYQHLRPESEARDPVASQASTVDDPRQRHAPLPPRARTMDDTLFRVVLPAPDPFGYPAVTIDKRHVTRLLRTGKYEELEAMLRKLRDRTRSDIRHEIELQEAYRAFGSSDPELEPHLAAWLAASPGSAEARFARAEYYLARAWESRGNRYIRDTEREQIAGMRRFAGVAVDEVQAGLELDPENVAGHAIHLAVLHLGGWSHAYERVLDKALRIFPTSFTIRAQAMATMQPRWGGSYRRMDRFADEADAFVAQNPRLRALHGYSLAERGYTHYLDDDYAAAVHYYTRALARGGEHWSFYLDRARVYYRVEDYARALEDLVHAARQMPQDDDVLELKGKTLYKLSAGVPAALKSVVLERALADFEVLHALQPTDEDAREWLDLLRERTAGQRQVHD